MITTVLRELPAFVQFDLCIFQLVITINEDQSASIGYTIVQADELSPHRKSWEVSGQFWNIYKNAFSRGLCQHSGIRTEMDFRAGIYAIKKFLSTNQIKPHNDERKIQKRKAV